MDRTELSKASMKGSIPTGRTRLKIHLKIRYSLSHALLAQLVETIRLHRKGRGSSPSGHKNIYNVIKSRYV